MDDADTTNSASSKHFTNSTNDVLMRDGGSPDSEPTEKMTNFHLNILKKMDLVMEQQIRQNNQLEELNKNLAKLIEVVQVKVSKD